MSIFGIDKRNTMKQQRVGLDTSTPSRKKEPIVKKPFVQKANVKKRVQNSDEKRWYKFAYWQELTTDVFNIFNTHG
jgi:hypothetical protein